MRAHWHALPFLVPALAAVLVVAAPASNDDPLALLQRSYQDSLARRDDEHGHMDMHAHGHNHHAQPIVELNETEVTLYHAPTPPSYWSLDVDNITPDQQRYPALMGLHVFFMCAAFFGALPAGIALRSVKHAWHGLAVILFYVFIVLGLAANGLYKKLTPDMYEGEVHSSQGYFVILFALLLSAFDLIALIRRLVTYVKSVRSGQDHFTFMRLWRAVVLDREEDQVLGSCAEYAGLVSEEPDELEAAELKAREIEDDASLGLAPIQTDLSPRLSEEDDGGDEWTNGHSRYPQSATSERTVFLHSPRGSIHSDDTLHEASSKSSWVGVGRAALLKRVGNGMFGTAERCLVFAGLFQVTTGVVIYTGGCRQNYLNGCLAHLIKGGIFWCYGLASFARFLGSFSELGWAWNRSPRDKSVSAEFVECFVIFLYGITNTWMERFGALPGDPFTTKQVQHISIAVMFWFAGLIGMGIESKRIRRWLASSAAVASPKAARSQEAVAEPPSYIFSFNPFPALCIGITGAAMAAHFQTYLFQVQIHQLWGNLLTAFAVLRCLTYFFLWLSPPRSILPSRPPTEALASFFLACGGLVFQMSTEELTIAAMRRGHDDMMMFLNVAVAVTCLAFCWTLSVVAFKGWLKSHSTAAIKFHSSA